MEKMTREEYLDWCKRRAHEYLDRGDIASAIASMISDMDKHDETKIKNPTLNMLGMLAAATGDLSATRRFIDGFN